MRGIEEFFEIKYTSLTFFTYAINICPISDFKKDSFGIIIRSKARHYWRFVLLFAILSVYFFGFGIHIHLPVPLLMRCAPLSFDMLWRLRPHGHS